jgi:hypothetical protein
MMKSDFANDDDFGDFTRPIPDSKKDKVWASNSRHPKPRHSIECRLKEFSDCGIENIVTQSLWHGHRADNIEELLASLPVCDHCKKIASDQRNLVLSGWHDKAKEKSKKLNIDRSSVAETQIEVYTRDILCDFLKKQIDIIDQDYDELLESWIGVLIECIEERDDDFLYVPLKEGYLPRKYDRSDIVRHLSEETGLCGDTVDGALGCISEFIDHKSSQAFEPLGWFVGEAEDQYLICWKNILTPQTVPDESKFFDWNRRK